MTLTSFGIPLEELADWLEESELEEADYAAKRREDAQDIERDRLPAWKRKELE